MQKGTLPSILTHVHLTPYQTSDSPDQPQRQKAILWVPSSFLPETVQETRHEMVGPEHGPVILSSSMFQFCRGESPGRRNVNQEEGTRHLLSNNVVLTMDPCSLSMVIGTCNPESRIVGHFGVACAHFHFDRIPAQHMRRMQPNGCAVVLGTV